MRCMAIKTTSCIFIYIQFSTYLPSPYDFLAANLCEVFYLQRQFSMHSLFSPTHKNIAYAGSNACMLC
jgi:hypothetical protein